MEAGDIFLALLIVQFASSAMVFFLLMFLSAPYGKHNRKGWGVAIGSRTAWLVMELPAVAVIVIVFIIFLERLTPVNLVFLFMWEMHYMYRTFIYPVYMRGSKRNFPLLLVFFAFLFNCLNGYINGYFLATHGSELELDWFYSIPFLLGSMIFFSGLILHVRSDGIIRSLRRPGEKGYKVPRDGPFKYVSNPNYLGEIVQWWGWALLTFSVAGLAFALFTTANLFPRAISNHRWYMENFEDYPRERKMIIPFIL
jgi:protein-S-isoprenylcysteine O-methyltransferase Ste14